MNEKIELLIKEGSSYSFNNNCYSADHGIYSRPSVEMQSWIAEVEDFILTNYGENSSPYKVFTRFNRDNLDGNYAKTFDQEKEIIISSLKACLRISPKSGSNELDKANELANTFERFHLVAKQLRARHGGRATLGLHSLLQLYFDDIRKEEWTPSYAGGGITNGFSPQRAANCNRS